MKKRIMAALSGAAFLYALGIVGAVEQGAALARLWWTLPLLAFSAWAARQSENSEKNKNRGCKSALSVTVAGRTNARH